ncbi:MAG: HlyD family efflux transporter periplasmic adaptor subunit [Kiloniellales bacterium]
MVEEEAKKGKSKGRYVTWAVAIGLVVYVGWMLGPYLRSTLVRDAAVTTWIHVATSPIYGEVGRILPKPGDEIADEGHIVQVRNAKADSSGVDTASAEVEAAASRVKAASSLLAELKRFREERQRQFEIYRDVYLTELDVELRGTRLRLQRGQTELETLARLAARKEKLAKSGSAAQSDLDEARTRMLTLERLLAGLAEEESKRVARHEAALTGIIVLDDGSDPEWGERSLHELDSDIAHAQYRLAEAKANLRNAKAQAAAEAENFENLTQGHVKAPAGAVLWSTIVGEGAAVDIGTPVASWIDCDLLLVDVPVADAEVPLLKPGTEAKVIFEGDARSHNAFVYLTRGSASTIKEDDLAALAKGREAGVAQALLLLEMDRDHEEHCPVGHAAYVDFPDIGLIDVIRARLRI